ncbi:MAG: hypothetical protein ACREOF_18015 [Gemmatimonadales bacterium]
MPGSDSERERQKGKGIGSGGGRRDEEGFSAGLRRFSRRLATFGLGESQEPLLTDAVSSFDAEGNPR